jgi:hypothetical protein
MFSPTDYLFYYLLAFKYYFILEKGVKEIGREKERKKGRGGN